MHKKWKVTPKEADTKLGAFLRSKLGISLREAKKLLEGNHLQLNGHIERYASTPLQKNDLIELHLEEKEHHESNTEKVLFEDDDLMIINKPPRKVSTDENFPYPLVHRLDKETSGALILAKNERAKKLMQDLFRAGTVQKVYLAFVDGRVKAKRGKIESRIYKSREGVFKTGPKGALAITYWELVEAKEKESLIKVFPKTGKTHQIRLHLRDENHPILGDYHYARSFQSKEKPKRVMLHALSLSFTHPITKERMEVVAPLFKDFTKLFQKLKMKHKFS